MALTADNVVVGITGRVYVAPTTAEAPTDSTTVLAADYVDLGYVSADGVNFETSRSSSQIRSWQDAALIREVVTEATVTYSFMLLETTEAVIEAYFGNAIVDGKVSLNPNSTGGKKSFVIDVIDGDKQIRHFVPSGEILSIEAQSITNGDALGYGISITAYQSEGRSVDIFYSEFEV
jgi:hypothetical protein